MESMNEHSPKDNIGAGEKGVINFNEVNVCSWTDMRHFDNISTDGTENEIKDGKKAITDVDGGWYEEEELKMRAEHGDFIIVKMDNEALDYMCEICQIHSNSRRSLGIHCNGMKHLKKKKEWHEKHDICVPIPVEDDLVPPKKRFVAYYSTKEESGPYSGSHRKNPVRGSMRGNGNPYNNDGGRGRGYGDNLRGRGFEGPSMGRNYDNPSLEYVDETRGRRFGGVPRGRGFDGEPRGRGFGYSQRAREYGGQPRGRGYDNFLNSRLHDSAERPRQQHYPESEGNYIPPGDRTRSPDRRQFSDAKRYAWDDREKSGIVAGSGNGRAHSESADRRYESMEPPLPPSYGRLSVPSDDPPRNTSSYPRRWSPEEPPRRPVVQDVLPDRFRDNESMSNFPVAEDIMAKFRAPSPPKVDLRQTSKAYSLSQLSKLTILSQDDAKTGVNVVSSVLKSLKNFYQVKGNWKAVDLLIDAELKIGSVAALETSATKRRTGSTSPKRERLPY